MPDGIFLRPGPFRGHFFVPVGKNRRRVDSQRCVFTAAPDGWGPEMHANEDKEAGEL